MQFSLKIAFFWWPQII